MLLGLALLSPVSMIQISTYMHVMGSDISIIKRIHIHSLTYWYGEPLGEESFGSVVKSTCKRKGPFVLVRIMT